jgi:RNA polymerase sigma-70 factor (ECF subfamily)
VIGRALTLLSDERLAQLAAGGSDPAFAALYRRYDRTLFAYCRSITRNADDGWDALQNAMVKVLVALRRSERDAPIRPWLFCIAHNESVGILRRRAAGQRLVQRASFETAAGADEEAAIRESVAEIVTDVQHLPTGQRAALVMRELGDLDYGEIAIALETTEGNARQLVFAARSGLKDSRDGRGLACESVRHQLAGADGRLLRRRPLRAHLRSCDACRDYAASVRTRRPARAARGVASWWPLAGPDVLASLFRAGGGALSPGGSSLIGSALGRAAAIVAVVATGIGAADVVIQKPGDGGGAAAREAQGAVAERPAAKPEKATRSAAAAPARRPVSAGRVAAHLVPATLRARPKATARRSVRATGTPRTVSATTGRQAPASQQQTRHEQHGDSGGSRPSADSPPEHGGTQPGYQPAVDYQPDHARARGAAADCDRDGASSAGGGEDPAPTPRPSDDGSPRQPAQ